MKKVVSVITCVVFYLMSIPAIGVEYWNYNAKNVTGDNTGRLQGMSIGSASYTDNGYFNDLITGGPWVDVRKYMDGLSGRPTLAQWRANKATTDVADVIQVANDNARAVARPLMFGEGGVYYCSKKIVMCNTAGVEPIAWIGVLGYYPGIWGSFDDTSHQFSTNMVVIQAAAGLATPLIDTGQGRGVSLIGITLSGPGKTVVGSVGVSVKYGNSGFVARHIGIAHFETGVEVGTGGATNGDYNTFELSEIKDAYIGVHFLNSQNYSNNFYLTNVFARQCVKADYNNISINVIGGNMAAVYDSLASDIHQTTVASYTSGYDITLTDNTGIAVGQFLVVQGNSLTSGAAKPVNHNPLMRITNVSGNTVTVSNPVFVAGIVNGATVLYGWFPTIFYAGKISAWGMHIETAAIGGVFYQPILLYADNGEGRQSFRDIDYVIGGQDSSGNVPYNRLVPIVRSNGFFEMTNVSMTTDYPKFQFDSDRDVELRRNKYSNAPIIIGTNGYYPIRVRRFMERQALRWGEINQTAYLPDRLYYLLDYYSDKAGEYPYEHQRYESGTAPTTGMGGEFYPSAAIGDQRYLGWKVTSRFNGGFSSAEATPGLVSIDNGSNLATVTSMTGLAVGDQILIAGFTGSFYGGYGTIIREIIPQDNTILLDITATTTLSGAAITRPALEVKTFGRQNTFGTSAPATCSQGDIQWKTDVTTDNVIGWICTATNTPKVMTVPLSAP